MKDVPNIALKQERERRNWSQEDLAEKIGTTPITISRWERGVSSPSPYFRQKLCQLFEKNAEELGFSQSQDAASLPSDKPDKPDSPQKLDKIITAQQFSSPLLPNRERQNRIKLLKRVRATWIEGLLEQPLHRAAWIDLHLQEQPDALENPWRLQVQELGHPPHPLPIDMSIVQVYDEADGELLILGEPGSGKTTLLLQLTRTLLDRAEVDERHRMPIIFNLSSWAQQQKPLAAWLVDELKAKYQAPRQVAQDWIDTDQVLPLLDGLDEVAKEARTACVRQINNYCQSRQTHLSSPIVVCCRSEEYAMLSTRITIQRAVSILPLSNKQISIYLEKAGEQVKGLRQALDEDNELLSLARQPLMLNIFVFAYQGAQASEVPTGETREEMRQIIFARYVEHMLKRRGQSKHWKPEQVTHWLTFLAKQMQQHNQTVSSVENLQLTWLPRRGGLLSQLCVGVIGGLVGGLFVGLFSELFFILFFGGLLNGLLSGLIVGLFFGLDAKINPTEAFLWSWKKGLSGLGIGLAVGLLSGLVVGLLPFSDSFGQLIWLVGGLAVGLVFGLDAEINPAKALIWSWKKALSGLVVWLIVGLVGGPIVGLFLGLISGPIGGLVGGLVGGLFVGLVLGLVLGLSGRQLPERLSPNGGIWRSGKNGLMVGLLSGSVVGLVGGLVEWLIWGSIIEQLWWALFYGLIVGLAVGLLGGLLFGLDAFVKHFILRFFLSVRGELPWDLIPFLDEAAEQLLLRRVGGSYIFVHRQLLDYFATLDEPVFVISRPPV